MASPSLLLDEDVRLGLAEILRERGYDVVHVLEEGQAARSDDDQLAYAVTQGRTILTHNIRDYLLLEHTYQSQRRVHYGIILSDQISLRELLRRTLQCLSRHNAEDLHNRIQWLQDFK